MTDEPLQFRQLSHKRQVSAILRLIVRNEGIKAVATRYNLTVEDLQYWRRVFRRRQKTTAVEMSLNDDPLYSRNEAARYLGLKPHTLVVWAVEGKHDLPFSKIGRSVRYRKSDLDAFIENNRRGGKKKA
jgi:excisionase family DNA binding protein